MVCCRAGGRCAASSERFVWFDSVAQYATHIHHEHLHLLKSLAFPLPKRSRQTGPL